MLRRYLPWLSIVLTFIFLFGAVVSGDWVSKILAGSVLIVAVIMIVSQIRTQKYRESPVPDEEMIDVFDVPPDNLGERFFPLIFVGSAIAVVLAATLAFVYALWQWW
jgi:hypothetical protein